MEHAGTGWLLPPLSQGYGANLLRCSTAPEAQAPTRRQPVPCPVRPQLHRALPTSHRNLRGTRSRFARSPRSPLQGTLQDHPPPCEQFLLLSLMNGNSSFPSLPHGTATPAAAGPGQRGSPCAEGRQRLSQPSSDPSRAQTLAGRWVLPCTGSQLALVLQELPKGQGTWAHRSVSGPDKPPRREGSKKVQTRSDLLCSLLQGCWF